jgi:hypothetical protein
MVRGTGRISRFARLLRPPRENTDAGFGKEMVFLNVVFRTTAVAGGRRWPKFDRSR